MASESSYLELLTYFRDQAIVTIATGTTCACLGDERNLREFIVADEAAAQLRRAGHVVFSLLIDDSFDPLTVRQLRLAVGKDEVQIERYQHWCGKPIGSLPDPWDCHESFAAHFEAELLERLHRLGCYPTLISTAKLYAHGLYAPYIATVLERYEEVRVVLQERCHGYQPEKLLWVVCPHCDCLDATQIDRIDRGLVHLSCERCTRGSTLPFAEVRAKLNWKLDCAARWQILRIDAEPFGKDYLDPLTGSFLISRTVAREFFEGRPVLPLPYGQVKIDRYCSYKLLEALPPGAVRSLFVECPQKDIHLTRAFTVTTASRHEVAPELTYLDFVKQLLPIWMTTPDRLTAPQRDLVAQGLAFSRYFMDTPIGLHLPTRAAIQEEAPAVLARVSALLLRVTQLRSDPSLGYQEFHERLQGELTLMGEQKKQVMHRLRVLTGQEKGLPATRFLFLLPPNYLQLLIDLLELRPEDEARIIIAPRVTVDACSMRSTGDGVEVTVGLSRGGHPEMASLQHTGPDLLEAFGTAAAHVLSRFLPAEHCFTLAEMRVLPDPDGAGIVAAWVRLETPRGGERLIGAVPLLEDRYRSAVNAVLDATNRRLSVLAAALAEEVHVPERGLRTGG